MTIAPLSNSILGTFSLAERTAFNAGLNLAIAAIIAWENEGARDSEDLICALKDMRFV